MTNALLIATASVKSEADLEAYDRWYLGTHIPEVSAAFGCVVKVTRYAVVDPMTGVASKTRATAVYELETDDLKAAAERFFAAIPTMNMTDLMDREIEPPVMQWVSQLPAAQQP
jgi:hypothetical protein